VPPGGVGRNAARVAGSKPRRIGPIAGVEVRATAVDMLDSRGEIAGQGVFQVILADNDLPRGARDWIPNHIELSYENPLVPEVQHPGPGVATLERDQELAFEIE
jgi:hypothetical protein